MKKPTCCFRFKDGTYCRRIATVDDYSKYGLDPRWCNRCADVLVERIIEDNQPLAWAILRKINNAN